MIRAQDEGLGLADYNVQPVWQAGVGIIGLVLMGVALQGRDIASVAIAVDRTALGKRGLSKLFDICPD